MAPTGWIKMKEKVINYNVQDQIFCLASNFSMITGAEIQKR